MNQRFHLLPSQAQNLKWKSSEKSRKLINLREIYARTKAEQSEKARRKENISQELIFIRVSNKHSFQRYLAIDYSRPESEVQTKAEVDGGGKRKKGRKTRQGNNGSTLCRVIGGERIVWDINLKQREIYCCKMCDSSGSGARKAGGGV